MWKETIMACTIVICAVLACTIVACGFVACIVPAFACTNRKIQLLLPVFGLRFEAGSARKRSRNNTSRHELWLVSLCVSLCRSKYLKKLSTSCQGHIILPNSNAFCWSQTAQRRQLPNGRHLLLLLLQSASWRHTVLLCTINCSNHLIFFFAYHTHFFRRCLFLLSIFVLFVLLTSIVLGFPLLCLLSSAFSSLTPKFLFNSCTSEHPVGWTWTSCRRCAVQFAVSTLYSEFVSSS